MQSSASQQQQQRQQHPWLIDSPSAHAAPFNNAPAVKTSFVCPSSCLVFRLFCSHIMLIIHLKASLAYERLVRCFRFVLYLCFLCDFCVATVSRRIKIYIQAELLFPAWACSKEFIEVHNFKSSCMM